MFSKTSLALSAAFLSSLCWSILFAQNAPPRHPPAPKVLGPAEWKPAGQQLTAAYWTLEPGWGTDPEMRNNVTHHELTVTPVLRMYTGQEITLKPVTIAPQHTVSIDLREASQVDAAIPNHIGSFGSVAFRFQGLDSGNLFAAAIVRRDWCWPNRTHRFA